MRLYGIAAILVALSYLLAIPSASADPVQAAAETLTPVEAENALEVLQDPGKRQTLIETLRTIAKVSPRWIVKSSAATARTKPPSASMSVVRFSI